ncbi:GRB2-associated-binding protein 1 isoform X2 [Periophthalmus magnuspinnatus]|uniref:GRB2-associated-binding protein 1 isoform X2 n=1 Tax=Periophthalmus magnuspinnatus TaxID=409849 RepID=UPI00243699AD|nr:GRB2-associated-binding protein 1 isoform X2 [Periophthalmus magnuspinnatus]
MSGGEVVCSGWLRKSPPEKKLRRYAWKKRWFVLRNGRLTGDPDVLEYYKNDHAKKPIRVIDLNLCEQVDAGLTFNKKDLEHSFIFDIKTIDRVFYLVADTEEEMNKWVHSICEICGFNPTDDEAAKASSQSSTGQVVDTPPHPAHHGNIIGPAASVLSAIPPPYQPVHVPHLESQSSSEEPTEDYLWLVNCESKKPDPHRAHAKSTSSETDLNDNLPSHRTPTSTSSAKHSSHNGFFPQHHGPASASSIYDSPPSRGTSFSTDTGLYHLPRSYSQDTVLGPKSAPSPSTHPDSTESPEIYTFNTPSRKASMEMQMRNMSISYDFPTTPGSNCTYQVPRTMPSTGSEGGGDVVPPPRPPKPSLTSTSGPPPPPAERSPTDNYCVPRSASETDGNYCVPTATGNKALRSNTIGTVDCSRLRKDFGSQDCYDIPRSFPSDKSCSFDFNESFNSYFKNKGMMPLGSQSTEEVDQNYVPMSANSPSHHSGSLSEPIHEANYVPMTPSSMEFSSLGKQVPPPAHMGFRSSPKTPPRRPMMSDCQPPPVDRNLKPDRKGQSPKIIRAKGVGLERTDSQTVGEFPRGRRKGKPAPLEIKPLPEWEEPCTPVRSPVTRSFAREEESFYCTVPITPIKREVEEVEPIEENMKLVPPMTADGGSSPMSKPKGDKQVEYLDLDLESGTSTPPRKMKSNGAGMPASDERVDYVVVDRQRTQALKSTREAWNDGRQSTDTDTPNKGTK